jgi:hypothetical protein
MVTLKVLIKEFKEEVSFKIRDKVHRRQIVSALCDNMQLLFLEFRGPEIDKLRNLQREVGDDIIVEIEFRGKESNNKYFNNIVVKNFSI